MLSTEEYCRPLSEGWIETMEKLLRLLIASECIADDWTKSKEQGLRKAWEPLTPRLIKVTKDLELLAERILQINSVSHKRGGLQQSGCK